MAKISIKEAGQRLATAFHLAARPLAVYGSETIPDWRCPPSRGEPVPGGFVVPDGILKGVSRDLRGTGLKRRLLYRRPCPYRVPP